MTTDEPQWTTLMTAPNQPMAEMTAERLEQAGIPAVLVPGDAGAYLGASSPYLVNVPADKLAAAKAALND